MIRQHHVLGRSPERCGGADRVRQQVVVGQAGVAAVERALVEHQIELARWPHGRHADRGELRIAARAARAAGATGRRGRRLQRDVRVVARARHDRDRPCITAALEQPATCGTERGRRARDQCVVRSRAGRFTACIGDQAEKDPRTRDGLRVRRGRGEREQRLGGSEVTHSIFGDPEDERDLGVGRRLGVRSSQESDRAGVVMRGEPRDAVLERGRISLCPRWQCARQGSRDDREDCAPGRHVQCACAGPPAPLPPAAAACASPAAAWLDALPLRPAARALA